MNEMVNKMPRIERNLDATRTCLMNTLECSLCLSLICEPISIPCGHSFCRVCLVKSLRRHKKRCPSCREICHVQAETASENIIIKSLAEMVDPQMYAARLAESVAEKESWSAVYPIFYYNSAMFPGNKLSLHLFEPRYKLMIQRIVNTTKAFAYVPNFTNYHAQINDIALVAKLTEVEILPDGRCLLEAVLSSRYQLLDHYVEDGTQGLHYCRLQPYSDDPIDLSAMDEVKELMQQGRSLVEYVAEINNSKNLIEQRFGKAPNVNEAELFSLWLTGLSPLTEEEKLQFLVSKDTKDRLERCVQRLAHYVNRMNQRKQISSMISQAGSTILTSANNAIRGLISRILPSEDQPDEASEEHHTDGEMNGHNTDTSTSIVESNDDDDADMMSSHSVEQSTVAAEGPVDR